MLERNEGRRYGGAKRRKERRNFHKDGFSLKFVVVVVVVAFLASERKRK